MVRLSPLAEGLNRFESLRALRQAQAQGGFGAQDGFSSGHAICLGVVGEVPALVEMAGAVHPKALVIVALLLPQAILEPLQQARVGGQHEDRPLLAQSQLAQEPRVAGHEIIHQQPMGPGFIHLPIVVEFVFKYQQHRVSRLGHPLREMEDIRGPQGRMRAEVDGAPPGLLLNLPSANTEKRGGTTHQQQFGRSCPLCVLPFDPDQLECPAR